MIPVILYYFTIIIGTIAVEKAPCPCAALASHKKTPSVESARVDERIEFNTGGADCQRNGDCYYPRIDLFPGVRYNLLN